MIRHTEDLSPAARAGFHAIIDVRSPAEFAADHVPGAINLPVLDDAERARVGTLYVQESHFVARRLGAALVAANVARHLQQSLADRPPDFRPLIYCWRGGMRSGAMATIFDSIGWQTTVIAGGYRRWRRQVVAGLYADAALSLPLRLLDGATGSGKTAVLGALQAQGAQVLDLEALAQHRGSLFGAMPQGQPTQKWFESQLFDALLRLDATRPVFAEAESSRIGSISLPPALWATMIAAPRIELKAELAWRVRHILANYGWIASDPAALLQAIARLPSHHAAADRARWAGWVQAGNLPPLVEELMRAHYDPAYARSRGRRAAPSGCIAMAAGVDAAAAAILALPA